MPHVEVHSSRPGRVCVDTSFVDRYRIKELPGAKYDGTSWHAPLTWATCVTLRGLFGDQLTVGPELTKWAINEIEARVNPCLRLRTELAMPDDDDSLEARTVRSWRDEQRRLMSFQEVDVLLMYRSRQMLLGEPMGAGKSVIGVSNLRLLRDLGHDPFPCLIVCPNSVKAVWERELAAWLPGTSVQVVSGSAGERRRRLESPADVYIINWEALRLHSKLAGYGTFALTDKEKEPKELNAIPWRTVIADEAHRGGNPRSAQTRALWAASKPATYRYALTGTPIDSHLGELWSILHFLNPEEWPSKTRYIDRWTDRRFNTWGGMEVLGVRADTKDEFFKIFDPRFRRLPKRVILPQLPPLVVQSRLIEMSPKQRKAYRQMLDTLMAEIDDGLLMSPNPLTRTLRLLQFSSSFASIDEAGDVELALPSNKIDFLEETLEELEDEQVVVFTTAPGLVNLASERLTSLKIDHAKVIGEVSVDQRAANVADFQAGRVRVILANMQTGGEGITLTAAPVLIRLQRHWRNLLNLQSLDRVHRIGSERHEQIRVIDAITQDSVEVGQLAALSGKMGRLEELVRDREMMMTMLRGEVEIRDLDELLADTRA